MLGAQMLPSPLLKIWDLHVLYMQVLLNNLCFEHAPNCRPSKIKRDQLFI
jgi:hypothetical protein